jgi:hypothetical protein
MGPAADSMYPLGANETPMSSAEPKRYGPRSVHADALPIDLRMRSIEEQRRNPDGSYTKHGDDAPVIEQFLQRIVNSLEILTKPKYIKKSFFTRQLTLVGGADAALFIDAQALRGYLIQNTSGITAYVGAMGVTASSGFEIQPNKTYEFYLEEGVNLYAFSAGNAVLQYIAL